jgi:hypothetical protein
VPRYSPSIVAGGLGGGAGGGGGGGVGAQAATATQRAASRLARIVFMSYSE